MAAATQEVADALRGATSPQRPHDWHMLQRLWLADLPAAAAPAKLSAVRVGLVCPYSWDIPGGVQAHVRDLAEALIGLGHEVSVLAPADDDDPAAAVRGRGRAGGPGPLQRLGRPAVSSGRCPRPGCGGGCATADFDVLHVHEPVAPSLSLLALMLARGPIVATFHTSITRSRVAVALPGHAAAVPGEDQRPDRGVSERPGRCRSSTSAATRW